jgi:hypothetical protein
VVESNTDGTITVCGLTINHPGHVVEGGGANLGWSYSRTGDSWERLPRESDCPCNNDLRHELQFSILRFLNESLREGRVLKLSDTDYRHTDLQGA